MYFMCIAWAQNPIRLTSICFMFHVFFLFLTYKFKTPCKFPHSCTLLCLHRAHKVFALLFFGSDFKTTVFVDSHSHLSFDYTTHLIESVFRVVLFSFHLLYHFNPFGSLFFFLHQKSTIVHTFNILMYITPHTLLSYHII